MNERAEGSLEEDRGEKLDSHSKLRRERERKREKDKDRKKKKLCQDEELVLQEYVFSSELLSKKINVFPNSLY